MKILFYIESLRSGGKERRLVELIKGLAKYPDIEMELVLTREDIHYKDIFDTGIKIHYTIRKGLKKDPRLFYKFYKIVKEFRPDIIHVWGGLLVLFAIPSKILFRKILINNSITYALEVKKWSKLWLLSKLTFSFSDSILSNSEAGLRTHGLKRSKKHRVIYNGFDINRFIFNYSDLKKELKIPEKSLLIGMIGSLTSPKDYATFISAANNITFDKYELNFLCIGDGENRKQLQGMVDINSLNRVHFLGRRTDIENICSNLDIGVLLSNTRGHAEGISNAIMELMAAGKPIIATNAGGTPELVKNGVSGFLIDAFNQSQLETYIIKLADNKELRMKMGVEGKRIIQENFLIDKMVNSYVSLYNELLNG